MTIRSSILAAAAVALCTQPVVASELSYTFVDFEVLSQNVELSGTQQPIPNQSVRIRTDNGDGLSVGGGISLPAGLYLAGRFRTAIVDVEGTIQSPLTVVTATDEFDLVTTQLTVGYRRELAENFDVTVELSRDTADYDFGSFAGENFDTDGSGLGGRIGFRWNPRSALELFASARYSPVGTPVLSERRLDSDTTFGMGLRWYFFQDLGMGIDYESGNVSTLTLGMRFGFGNIAW